VIRAGKPGSAVVIVAASGGGIKAAAWTARVLTGLEESNPHRFGDSVRSDQRGFGRECRSDVFRQRV